MENKIAVAVSIAGMLFAQVAMQMGWLGLVHGTALFLTYTIIVFDLMRPFHPDYLAAEMSAGIYDRIVGDREGDDD